MTERFLDLKLERPLAFLDLETTGRDPRTDRIVELAVLKFAPAEDPTRFRHFKPDGQRVRLCHRVDPMIPIPTGASDIHGITDADVVGKPTFRAIAHQLDRFLEDCDLAGYHLKRFDLPLLMGEFKGTGVAFTLEGRSILYLMQMYHLREPRNLEAAVRFYAERDHAGAHGALADATATADVLEGMLARYPDLPRTVAELHGLTAGVDIEGKFTREGDRIVLAFGKHQGRPLDEVARDDPGYLKWMLGLELLADARGLVVAALASRRAS
jgi:DNA polymerase III subunit epsilon